ncbi:hypothetical protein [uncultured Campylobacter sp.]|uniref:hypothetical protein n=1 Tax=uncultured Campylobacter sp. TaxID=218934 RepID=UPI00260DDCDF|nr:hypothetical protein [uncultured Campylobacter sp.]
MEFYCFVAAERPSCGDIEFYLASVLWRRRILSRFGAAATQNFISLRHDEISALRRRGLFKFDAVCVAPERLFKF